MRRWIVLLTAVPLALAAACDDDDDSGGGSTDVNSGIAAGETVDSLDDGDGERLCTAIERASAHVVDASTACTLAGLLFSSTPDECRQFEQLCRSAAEQPVEPDDGSEGTCPFADPAQRAACTATVEEIEGCIEASLQMTRAVLSALDCSQASGEGGLLGAVSGGGGLGGLESLETLPTECVGVQQKCPNLFRDGVGGAVDMGPGPDPEADAGAPQPDGAAPAPDGAADDAG